MLGRHRPAERRPVRALLTVALALALALPAGALPGAGNPGPGYFATDNVEWLGNIPLNADSAGARLVDGWFYITDDRGLTIYDVSNPELPVPTGFWPAPQNAYFVEEDPDTNGEILLISGFSDLTNGSPASWLFVLDVSDKSLPVLTGVLHAGQAQQHTWSCVLDCTWAYGNSGSIADLREPSDPKLSTVRWTQAVGDQVEDTAFRRATHDVTEVSPGLVVTSSNPVYLLDVEDPEDPQVRATGELPDNRYIHGNLWPNGATDPILLVGGETGGDCADEADGAFMTFDASSIDLSDEAIAEDRVGSFELIDEHRVFTGLYPDGDSPYDQYCAHWFSEHPTFDGGGLVAMGWYEHGVRFLDVADNGNIEEVGWFLPLGGSTSAAYWITDEILYTADYQRGLDIIRFDADAQPGEGQVVGDVAAAVAQARARPQTPRLPGALPVSRVGELSCLLSL